MVLLGTGKHGVKRSPRLCVHPLIGRVRQCSFDFFFKMTVRKVFVSRTKGKPNHKTSILNG